MAGCWRTRCISCWDTGRDWQTTQHPSLWGFMRYAIWQVSLWDPWGMGYHSLCMGSYGEECNNYLYGLYGVMNNGASCMGFMV